MKKSLILVLVLIGLIFINGCEPIIITNLNCPQLDIPIFESRYQGEMIQNMETIPLKDITFIPIEAKNYNDSAEYSQRFWADFQVDNDLLNYFLRDVGGCNVEGDKIECLETRESENFIYNIAVYSSYYKERADRQDYSDPMKGWRISVLTPASIIGFEDDSVLCKRGSKEGENLNYYYCKNGLSGGQPYIIKTSIKNDGTIGKTTREAFINIYDENKNFIRTICLGDPIKIIEKESDERIKDIMS